MNQKYEKGLVLFQLSHHTHPTLPNTYKNMANMVPLKNKSTLVFMLRDSTEPRTQAPIKCLIKTL